MQLGVWCPSGSPNPCRSSHFRREKHLGKWLTQFHSGFLTPGDKDRSGDGIFAESLCFFSFVSPMLHIMVGW